MKISSKPRELHELALTRLIPGSYVVTEVGVAPCVYHMLDSTQLAFQPIKMGERVDVPELLARGWRALSDAVVESIEVAEIGSDK